MSDLRSILTAVVPLLLSAAIIVVGNGLFGTLLAVRMDLEAFPVGRIGLILACYSVGWIIGTLICPAIVRNVGHIRTFAAFAALAAASSLVHALYVSELLWALLRVLTGICMAAVYTIIESWLNAKAPNTLRGQVMSAYMAVNFVAYGSAQYLLTAMDPGGFQLFSLIAIIIAVSLVPLSLIRVQTPAEIQPSRLGLRHLIAISPLGVAGCFTAGLINGAFNAMGPVYARAIDPSPGWIAQFMMVTVLSGFLLQFPMGHLSDRFDRRRVMLGLTLAITAASLALALSGVQSTAVMIGLICLYGGVAYSLYPISLAHANDFMEPADLVSAAAGLLLCYGAGAVIGPILAALAMGRFGIGGLFFYSAVVGLALAGFAVYRMGRREAPPAAEKASFVAVPQTTPTVSELDPRSRPQDEEEQLAFDFY